MIVDLLPFEDVLGIAGSRYPKLGFVMSTLGTPSEFFYNSGIFHLNYAFSKEPEYTREGTIAWESLDCIYVFKDGPQLLGRIRFEVVRPGNLGDRTTFNTGSQAIQHLDLYRQRNPKATKVSLLRLHLLKWYERTLMATQKVWGTEFKHFDRRGRLK